MKKPNFFIAGAPKCGTTALSEYLKMHPNIFISTPKEPHYFAKDITPYSCCATLEEYLNIFKDVQDQQSAIGEASVLYLYSNVALKNIFQFNPDAKIIVMLRHPVDYIYSYYNQLLINGYEDIEDFEMAWRLQDKRRDGYNLPKTCRVPKLLYYEEIGKLGEQVEKLLEIFPEKQVNFILLEDMKKNAKKVYKEVLDFLEVVDDHRSDFPIINENTMYTNKTIGKLRNNPPPNMMAISRFVKKILGLNHIHFMAKIHEWNRKKIKRATLDDAFRGELIELYIEDINKLELLIRRDFSNWKAM